MNGLQYDTDEMRLLVAFGWAAGVVDAEGRLRKHKGSLELRVRSTDRGMLDRVAELLTGHVCGPYENGTNAEPIWEWKLPASDIPDVMTLLWPLLSPRQHERWINLLPPDWAGPSNVANNPRDLAVVHAELRG